MTPWDTVGHRGAPWGTVGKRRETPWGAVGHRGLLAPPPAALKNTGRLALATWGAVLGHFISHWLTLGLYHQKHRIFISGGCFQREGKRGKLNIHEGY